ncbi:MAG: NAD-dependent epimerase/dehydratase family protein [Gammaproteobacteria bacterium]
MTTRRQFLGAAAGGLGLAMARAGLSASSERPSPAGRPLDLLVLGGTGFIGPHQIEYALARGHRVTMFNRGSNPGLYGDRVEELIGNRDSRIDEGLASLAGDRTWDVVIDNSGYVPRHVRDSVELLKDRVGRYLYISTVAVYDFSAGDVFDVDGPLATPEDPGVEQVTRDTYGPLKAECDRIVRAALGERATVVRPTYIVGPGDTTDRFTYWVERIHRGGDVLAPALPETEIQWVDARDLCPWVIRLAEADRAGVFNAAGPAAPVDRRGLLWGIAATTSAPVRLHWPAPALLESLEIVPPMLSSTDGSVHFVNTSAMAAGLGFRPLAETVLATHGWWQGLAAERRANPRRWITPQQEAEAIRRMAGTD